ECTDRGCSVSDLCSPASAASISASSEPGCASPGTPRSSLSPAPCSPDAGPESRITETCDLFGPMPSSPSMCSAEASPAKTFQSPERAPASTAHAPAYGANTPDLFESLDPVGSLLKTSLLLELEAITGS